jgi:hypothetical protein
MTWLAAIAGIFGRMLTKVGEVWPAISMYLLGRSQAKEAQAKEQAKTLQEDLDSVRRAQQIRRAGRGLANDERAKRLRRWQKRRGNNSTGRKL